MIAAALAAFRAEAGAGSADGSVSPDAVAAAFARHLAGIDPAKLPAAARTLWDARVARPLKVRADRAIASAAARGVASWPRTRIADLMAALAEIEGIVARADNDALSDAIVADVARAYL